MEQLRGLIDLKTVVENNYLGTRNHHKQPLCKHTEPLCGLIDLKSLLKNNFQSPMFIRLSPNQQ